MCRPSSPRALCPFLHGSNDDRVLRDGCPAPSFRREELSRLRNPRLCGDFSIARRNRRVESSMTYVSPSAAPMRHRGMRSADKAGGASSWALHLAGAVLKVASGEKNVDHQPRLEVHHRISFSKKRTRPRSRTGLKVIMVILIAMALAGGYAIASGWLSLSASNGPGGPNGPAPGSTPSSPEGVPLWPQNSTLIVQTLCRNGSTLFWVRQQNFSAALDSIGQQALSSCNIGQTSGGVVRSQQGWYLDQITAESVQTTFAGKKH
jgi:hypothetical protein